MSNSKEPILAEYGQTIVCPGCGEVVTLDLYNGWRNARGYTCKPASTTHSQHISTIIPSEVNKEKN